MKKLAALTAIVILAAGSLAYSEEFNAEIKDVINLVPESGPTGAEGYVEDFLLDQIVLYGHYYYVGGASIKDLSGLAVDREKIRRGAKVRLKLKGGAVTEVIYVHGPIGEGFKEE